MQPGYLNSCRVKLSSGGIENSVNRSICPEVLVCDSHNTIAFLLYCPVSLQILVRGGNN